MNTPITDDYYEHRIGRPGEETPASLARRLELDRAKLMEALEAAERHLQPAENTAPNDDRLCDKEDAAWMVLCDIRFALAAARANFPRS